MGGQVLGARNGGSIPYRRIDAGDSLEFLALSRFDGEVMIPSTVWLQLSCLMNKKWSSRLPWKMYGLEERGYLESTLQWYPTYQENSAEEERVESKTEEGVCRNIKTERFNRFHRGHTGP